MGSLTVACPSAYRFVFNTPTIYVADDANRRLVGLEKWTQSGGT